MSLQTFLPHPHLRPYIKYIAISEVGSAQEYKVLPSTALVMGFQFKGRLSYLLEGKEAPLSAIGITGLQAQYRIFKNTAETGSVLVAFKEARAGFFFSIPIHELFGESLSLDHLVPPTQVKEVEEKLSEAFDNISRIRITEDFLLSQLHQQSPDLLVQQALLKINETKGSIRIKELAKDLCSSQSPLEKRFRKCVGTSPKMFASLVRFQHVLSSNNSNYSQLAYEAGYFDQAHFMKDFKTFTGETPEQFRKNKTGSLTLMASTIEG